MGDLAYEGANAYPCKQAVTTYLEAFASLRNYGLWPTPIVVYKVVAMQALLKSVIHKAQHIFQMFGSSEIGFNVQL